LLKDVVFTIREMSDGYYFIDANAKRFKIKLFTVKTGFLLDIAWVCFHSVALYMKQIFLLKLRTISR